jgi:hypothetical protein
MLYHGNDENNDARIGGPDVMSPGTAEPLSRTASAAPCVQERLNFSPLNIMLVLK